MIYIPIWIYSNNKRIYINDLTVVFTFQYGSTQITSTLRSLGDVSSFTFQYGSTQIKINDYIKSRWDIYIPIWIYSNPMTRATRDIFTNLHSNMDLLKSTSYTIEAFLNPLFTFQYGSTQMGQTVINASNLTTFTFQYGSTQICSL